MPQHGNDASDKDVEKQAPQLLQILGLFALVVIALADGYLKLNTPTVVYYILGALVLGVDKVSKIFPGGKP